MTLLKKYTNNDRINEMSIEEKVEFLDTPFCELCSYTLDKPCTPDDCKKQIKAWLESEAER